MTVSPTPTARAPPLPPSPMMTTTMGTRSVGDLPEVVGDGLGLAALLGADAGIGAGSIDQGDDREAEFLGCLHHPERLPVAFRVGLAEVPGDPFPCAPALLVPDEGGGLALVEAQAGDDGRIIGETPVAVHLGEILHQAGDVVQGVRTLGMAGHLDDLGGGQVGADLGPLLGDLPAEVGDLGLPWTGPRISRGR